jgi:cell division protein FtsA
LANRPRYAAGIDVGSAAVRCVVGVIENQRLRFAGAGEVASSGWHEGRVNDQDQLADAIRAAVKEAEKQAHFAVEMAVTGMAGSGIQGRDSQGTFSIGGARELQQADLHYAMQVASRLSLGSDRLLLQVCPQEFIVDGHGGQRNPRGLKCSNLVAHAHLITALVHDHQALISAMHMAHLAVEDTVFEPLAAAYVSLLAHDRARGVILVNIGHHSTDWIIYSGESVIKTGHIPINGAHFTSDVAAVMTLSYEVADRLKTEFGCALLGLTADDTQLELPSSENRPAQIVERHRLIQVLEARAEELFLLVRQQIRAANMEGKLLEGLVLTGGTSEMQGMLQAAEKVLNIRARHAQPLGIEQWPSELPPSLWTTAAGLCLYSGRLKIRQERQRKPFHFF